MVVGVRMSLFMGGVVLWDVGRDGEGGMMGEILMLAWVESRGGMEK
ncbi:MAG: hypothetical protein NC548_42760 [Lachnospiraceae bacterium]|nr:hypothetical protein [Lachnospiraceae bacterium]